MQKFFNVGLPRTGTASYSKALNLRGVLDLHYPLQYLTDLRNEGRMKVYRHPRLDWQGLSHANEHPGEYQRLPDLYPEAKFALTTRDVDGWISSFENLLSKGITKVDPVLNWRLELIAGVDYQQKLDRGRLKEFFLAHDEAARKFFGSDLLLLDLRENDTMRAEKLSKWLGVEAIGYPHLHELAGSFPIEYQRVLESAANQVQQLQAEIFATG